MDWYESFGTPVYSYFRFHVASPDIAEDLTADAFLKAFRSADRFDPAKGTARVWIFRIAQNVLRDHRRRARLRQYVPLGNLRDLAVDAPSPEERLVWEEQVARLLDALALLGGQDREIISLRYGSALDAAAVGEILGLSETAVRTRLWRALKRLRAVLADQP